MRGFPRVRAVFHCFTGSIEEARKILDAGYLLGFTGAVTFKKNDALREACALVPLDRLLIETDAPYLTPEPMRKQKTNEPAFVAHVAAVVARVKNRTVAELDRITTRNVAAAVWVASPGKVRLTTHEEHEEIQEGGSDEMGIGLGGDGRTGEDRRGG